MVETAAHLADRVLPPLPVRQWVLAVPKRLRYFHLFRVEALLYLPNALRDEDLRASLDALASETRMDVALGEGAV
jgi:hypothetical protein